MNLIVRDDSALAVSVSSDAQAMRSQALECAALIGRVSTATEQDQAVEAHKEIKRVLLLVEDSRVAVKKPVLDFGRLIDSTAKEFTEELKQEAERLSRLVGNFQTLELAKERAAEAARLKELSELERRRQEELAKATSHDELDEINARANEEAAAMPIVAPARTNGQTVREDWEFTVSDPRLLAWNHPSCVSIEPRMGEIKRLLSAGITPAGISNAKKVVVSGVRLGNTKQLLPQTQSRVI